MNLRKTLLFFSLATIVSAVLRTLIIFFTTDSESGFLKQKFAFFSYGMIGIILVAAVLCVFFSFKCKRPRAPHFWKYVIAVISVALGISVFAESIFFDFSSTVSPMYNFAQSILGILSGVVFVWFGGSFAKLLPSPDFFLIVPVFFYIFRLIVVFITYSGLATTVDIAFELVTLCSTLVFIIKFSKILLNVNDDEKIGILPIGLCAAFINLTQGIPVAIIFLSENSDLLHSNMLFFPSSIIMGIFILCFSIFRVNIGNSVSIFYRPRHDNAASFSIYELLTNEKEDN